MKKTELEIEMLTIRKNALNKMLQDLKEQEIFLLQRISRINKILSL